MGGGGRGGRAGRPIGGVCILRDLFINIFDLEILIFSERNLFL